MSQLSGAHVYTGIWVNWSRGPVLGSTLTLSDTHGSLLTAFLGIFVTAVGGAMWRITSFMIHQSRAKRAHQDGLHHQQQAIFRNASTPGSASWQLLQLLFHWSGYAKRPALRILPLAALALTNLVLFSLAGVFSAQVTKAAGNETLIRSPNCGTWDVSSHTGPLEQAAFRSKTLLDTTSASTYARSCYGVAPNSLSCNQYAQSSIPWAVNQNASCPFHSGMCMFGDTAAYQMDTGPIDSHRVLGINAPPSDRITYRKFTTCSPIRTKGHAQEWNNTNPDTVTFGDRFDRLYLGPIKDVSNFTFQYDEHTTHEQAGYQLTSIYATPGTANVWEPIPELNRTDADVSVFFLAQNNVYYDSPVLDPFFSANIKDSTPAAGTGENLTSYLPDIYVTALGCIDQHQFCNPSNNLCTPLTGYDLINNTLPAVALNPKQTATIWRILLQLMYVNTYSSVHGRGSSALRASETLSEFEQVGLPNHQWQIEVDSWMAVGMAKLQQLVVQYATGPPPVVGNSFTLKPPNAIWQAMCGAQKIRSADGTLSFSILGVAIILILGTVLILLNQVLDLLVGFIQRKLDWGDHKRLQWAIDEKLQLQRLAYEGAGQGIWTGGASAVPVMMTREKIGVPSNVNKDHPKLSSLSGHGRPEVGSRLPSDGSLRQSGLPETQTLMGPKGAWYDVQSVQPAPGYHAYQG